MVDIYRGVKWRGKYPPLATDSEIIQHKNMILTHLFLQRLQHFRAQIPRELLGGE